jgi:methylenetetrahydrofolate reductase (NADPH)
MTPSEDPKQWVVDFVRDFTVETTPGSAAKIPDFREHLRPGTKVAVTFLPGSDFADTIAVCRRLRGKGFEPMPHFAARSIPSRAHLEDWLKALSGEVGITEIVALAGAVDQPVGDFDSSMAMLDTGLFDKYAIRRIGIAGHPEGSPDISEEAIRQALAWKNAFAERTGAELYVVTQFCFEAAPLIAWDRMVQAEGNRLPIHIGIPGLATIKTLIGHAKACGIGPSMQFLTRQARNIAKLLTVSTPDKLLLDLARYKVSDPACGIRLAHFYPLGGLRKTAAWTYGVVDGDFTLKPGDKGFSVNREIT